MGEYFTSGLFCPQRKHLAHEHFITFCFSRGGVVSASPNTQAGRPPLVGCPRLLIQYIRSYPPYRRPFLHPQPEDAPCRGDRDPKTRILLVCYRLKTRLIGQERNQNADRVITHTHSVPNCTGWRRPDATNGRAGYNLARQRNATRRMVPPDLQHCKERV